MGDVYITFSKVNIVKILYLICWLCSSFVNRPNNVLPSTLPSAVSPSQTSGCTYFSWLQTPFPGIVPQPSWSFVSLIILKTISTFLKKYIMFFLLELSPVASCSDWALHSQQDPNITSFSLCYIRSQHLFYMVFRFIIQSRGLFYSIT